MLTLNSVSNVSRLKMLTVITESNVSNTKMLTVIAESNVIKSLEQNYIERVKILYEFDMLNSW